MQIARLPSLKVLFASIITEEMPYLSSVKAAVNPIGPAPTITTSTDFSLFALLSFGASYFG